MGESRTSAMFGSGAAALLGRVWRRAASAYAVNEGEPALLAADNLSARLGGFGHAPGRAISPHCVARFAELSMSLDAAGLVAEVDALRARAISEQTICLELIAPAARMLAQMWERDECDFVEVAMGLWRLQEVLRETAAHASMNSAIQTASRRALFATLPGDAHSFAALTTSGTFVSAGWQSEVLVQPRCSLLFAKLGRYPFDVLGLTVTRDCTSGALANLIRALRSVSANPQLVVLVGGTMVSRKPGIAVAAGADGFAADGPAALALAEALVNCPPALRAALR